MDMGVPSIKNEFRYHSRSRHLFSLLFQIPPQFLSPPSLLAKTIASTVSSSSIGFDSDHFQPKFLRNLPTFSIFSTGSSPKPQIFGYGIELVNPHHYRGFQPFSASSINELSPLKTQKRVSCTENSSVRSHSVERSRSKPFWKKARRILDLIKRVENNFEPELNRINVSLSVTNIAQILQLLNSEKVSALSFFNWIRGSRPDLTRNYEIYSLVVDNCGRLNDYESLTCTLNEINLKRICLTPSAFRFLPESAWNEESLMDSVSGVVDILNAVGGKCRTSGVRSLIEMFSSLGSFEMVKFVMKITERNTSYYNIMIRETCRRRDLEGSRALLDEMRQVGCKPNLTSYNLVLSNSCNNGRDAEELLKGIEEMDCSPDGLTFELLISHLCKLGKFDFALELLDKMRLWGVEPRLTAHAIFVKGYFKLRRYEEAHNYVVGASLKYRYSSNVSYSLLADLYLNENNLVSALSVVSEIIDKGLRPSFRVYVKLLKGLQRSGRVDEARDLEKRFSAMIPETITETG